MLKLSHLTAASLAAEHRQCWSCLARFALAVYPSENSVAIIFTPLRSLSTSTSLCKGHSKWQNIKDIKAKKDDARARRMAFYFAQLRTVLREGTDPKFNKKLVDLERNYVKESLPLETLHRCIQRLKEKPDVTLTYQLLGPGGSQFIVQMEAETKSKMQNAITKLLKKQPSFKLTDSLIGEDFVEKGVIILDSLKKSGERLSLENVEEIGIDLECEEVLSAGSDEGGEKFELICDPEQLYMIESKLSSLEFDVLSAQVQMLPLKDRIRLEGSDAATVESFYETIEELEPVKEVFDNLEQDEGDNDATVSAAK